jgi:hypothetical protein
LPVVYGAFGRENGTHSSMHCDENILLRSGDGEVL